jgi:hypothetical protein
MIMDTPAGDGPFLDELERTVSTELATAEAGQPDEEFDPDAERYEVRLRSLLGAVAATERGSHRGDGQ